MRRAAITGWRRPTDSADFGVAHSDFGTNVLYGREDFRHEQFPGFGNGAFFVYVDYAYAGRREPLRGAAAFGAARLPATRRKLRAGQPVRMVAFGDSITAGGDASEPGLILGAPRTRCGPKHSAGPD